MELHDENRTALERMLADVWDYEEPSGRKARMPKWLFAVTLTGAVLCTASPSDVVAPVKTAFAPAPEKLAVDKVSSENAAEDLDYRVARHSESPDGWRAFLAAHPNGPHGQAARAEIDRLPPAPLPEPAEATEQSPPSAAAAQTPVEPGQSPTAPAPSNAVEKEPAPPPQPAEVSEQSPPSPAATRTSVEAAQPPAPTPAPNAVEKEPAPPPEPVEAGEQSPPSEAPTQTLVETAQPASSAPPVLMAETEPAPASQSVAVAEQGPPSPAAERTPDMAETEPTPPAPPAEAAANPPLPPSRPHETAVAKSVERAHRSHLRAERYQANQPNVFTILVAQLFHPHRERLDTMSNR